MGKFWAPPLLLWAGNTRSHRPRAVSEATGARYRIIVVNAAKRYGVLVGCSRPDRNFVGPTPIVRS